MFRMFSLVATSLFLAASPATAQRPETRDRSQIPDRYKWDFTRIYPSWEAWEADFAKLDAAIGEMAAYRGRLSEGAATFLEYQQRSDELGQIAYKVFRYPQLQRDTDLRDNAMLGRMQRVQGLFARWGTEMAWYEPELLSIPAAEVESWIAGTPGLAPYAFPVREVYRLQQHTLDAEQERLLSLFSRFNSTPSTIFGQLTTADAVFPEVEFSDGSKAVMSYAGYQRALRTLGNQDDRRKAFEAHFGVFHAKRNTIAAVYSGILERGWATARARRYESTLAAALGGNNIPTGVVTTLVDRVRSNTAPLRRYHQLRKRVLGLETYHLFDGSVPLVQSSKEYPYDAMVPLVLESLAPFGADFQAKAEGILSGGLVDVYENEGKRAGAYQAGVYGVGPFLLMNYNDTLDAAFTFAHELGHALHTALAVETQPFATSQYTIFVAEVASTMAEKLFLERLMRDTTDPRERVALLMHQIEGLTGTFFTQVLFADFELQAHRAAEQGRPITADSLSALYEGLLRDYYGDAVDHDPLYNTTWARIPHFFNSPYYVYQYATCFASTALIHDRIQSAPDEAARQAEVNRYLDMLRAGGSDHPMELLKRAGVDLTQVEAFDAVIAEFDRLIDQLEVELAKIPAAAE